VTPAFVNLVASDRVSHDRKEVYTSGGRVPPVPTTFWQPEDWARWDANAARVDRLRVEVEAAGYRFVTL